MQTNIEIIDTHCHLYSENLISDLDNIVQRSNENNVNQIFMPNVDAQSIEGMLEVESKYDHCHSMMGLHPCSVKEDYKTELQLIDKWFAERPFVGVGETGIDLYWDKTFYEEQKISFNYQIDLSGQANLPIIIHSRDSLDVTIKCIAEKQKGQLSGIFHCFTGTIEQANRIIDLGFYLGIGGVLTYKNSDLPSVIKSIDLNYIVLETDSPYLPPVPKRGKPNEPSFLLYVAEKLAEIKDETIQNVANITTLNAKNIFKI
jgi:TatD DNase family protein